MKYIKALKFKLLSKYSCTFLRRKYWDLRADEIHSIWGEGVEDHDTIREVINYVEPNNILDIGCGSGRTFPIYLEKNVSEVVGQDISSKALQICNRRFPNVPYRLYKKKIVDLDFRENYFDLIISTRVLSAVTPKDIRKAINSICRMGLFIYINEMTASDYSGPSSYWYKHEYGEMFSENMFSIVKNGSIKVTEDGVDYLQTWTLYKKD